jgi:hypothetical protein
VKESVVEIGGHQYRYTYNPETQRTEYLGPVGESPPLNETEFLALATLEVTVLSDHEKILLGHASIMRWFGLGQPPAFNLPRTKLIGPPSKFDDNYVVVKDTKLVGVKRQEELNLLKVYDENGMFVTEVAF